MSTYTEMTGVFEECYMSGLIKPVIFDMEGCLVWTDMLRSHDQTNNNTNIQILYKSKYCLIQVHLRSFYFQVGHEFLQHVTRAAQLIERD